MTVKEAYLLIIRLDSDRHRINNKRLEMNAHEISFGKTFYTTKMIELYNSEHEHLTELIKSLENLKTTY